MPTSRLPDCRLHSKVPLRREPSLDRLAAEDVTPVEDFFVACPEVVPRLEADTHSVEISGLVERPLTLRSGDLPVLFPQVDATVTLLAAGHRRDELQQIRPIPGATPWGAGAVGTAIWTGVPLGSVLKAAGVLDGAHHVLLVGADGGRTAAIPLELALGPDVLLAYGMNGQPLPPEHGFPLRAIVPGSVAERSVKWLIKVAVESGEPDLGDVRVAPLDDSGDGFPVGEQSITSIICAPLDGAELPAGPTAIEGFALAGGRRAVTRIDVSVDQGSTWSTAAVESGPSGAWRRWRAELDLGVGPHEIVARAWDSAANTQPEDPASLWNPGGYMNNAWHRVRIWSA